MARRKRLPAEPFRIRIERLLDNGRGQGVLAGQTLEVHDALPGEAVMARYLFGRRQRGQAQALEVLERSPDRVDARCRHFGTCSACTLQHLAPAAQIRFKQEVMLARLAGQGLVPDRVLPPLQADIWHYRRKARLSVRDVRAKGRVLVGFRERDGRFVADLQECHVLPEAVGFGLARLSRLLGSMDARAAIPQIEVTCGDGLCALVFRHLKDLSREDEDRLREYARETGLAVLLQPGGADSVRALDPARPALSYALPEFGLEYRFLPQDFVQVNAGLNERMVGQALELLDPGPEDTVLELFCGLGNFTLPLARRCRSVTGVEGDAGLVQRARDNARRNAIGNAEFRQADLYSEHGLTAIPPGPFTRLLLDPPRSGAGPALATIVASGAERVVYVSCNPATLAADAASLVGQHGYRLAAAGALDMFPHTGHVESMALFRKEG